MRARRLIGLGGSVLAVQTLLGRGLTALKQADVAHSGQPTLLCQLTLRLRALRGAGGAAVVAPWPPVHLCGGDDVQEDAGRNATGSEQ